MHNITLDMRMPDAQQACNIITCHNERLGICLDYDKLLEYYAHTVIIGRDLRKRIQKYLGYGLSGKMTPDEFLAYLKRFGVHEGLLTTKGGALSASSPSLQNAIDTGLYGEGLVVLMKAYQKLREAEYMEGALHEYTRYTPVNVPTFDGHRMIVVHPTWNVQATGRFAMKDPAIQNIAKVMSDVNTVPEGWILYECDSSQIEPRIIYSAFIPDKQIQALINLYNDAYFGLLHYVTMPIEDIASGRTDFVKHEITDEMQEKRQFLKKLGNGIMYGKQSNPGNDPLIENYIKRIGGHPMRVKWQKRCEEAVDRGQRIFNTVFGTPIDITVSDGKDKYTTPESERLHFIRCAINNPIQGTAGDLARYSVMMADHFLTRNCPNSVILKYTHDSGTFAIHEKDYDKAMPVLKDITAYQVEGWIPIYSKGEEGRYKDCLFPDIL